MLLPHHSSMMIQPMTCSCAVMEYPYWLAESALTPQVIGWMELVPMHTHPLICHSGAGLLANKSGTTSSVSIFLPAFLALLCYCLLVV